MSAKGRAAPDIDTTAVRWLPSVRIIPSRFPPIGLFERVSDPADLDAVFAIEALTNPRVRAEVGALHALPAEERVTGAGAGYIMASFTHLSPSGARFSTSQFGAYYAARTLETAIAETVHHRALFFAATRQPPMHIDMRVLHANVRGRLLDLRAQRDEHTALYAPDSYAASQVFAEQQRALGQLGVVYASVRDAGGECVAVWRPRVLSHCKQAAHLTYVWNGDRIAEVFTKSRLRRL